MNRRGALLLAVLALPACSRTSESPAPSPSASERIEARRAGKAFGEACVTDWECAGAVCFHKRLKGPDAGRERHETPGANPWSTTATAR